jgi:hypothetical protein
MDTGTHVYILTLLTADAPGISVSRKHQTQDRRRCKTSNLGLLTDGISFSCWQVSNTVLYIESRITGQGTSSAMQVLCILVPSVRLLLEFILVYRGRTGGLKLRAHLQGETASIQTWIKLYGKLTGNVENLWIDAARTGNHGVEIHLCFGFAPSGVTDSTT